MRKEYFQILRFFAKIPVSRELLYQDDSGLCLVNIRGKGTVAHSYIMNISQIF